MSWGIVFSIAAIGISLATILRTRCIEKRENAEYERRMKSAAEFHARHRPADKDCAE